MFDIEPDGDIHGECALEIHNLTTENETLKKENKSLKETLFNLAEKLGIDYDKAIAEPGKPSDVFFAYIESLRCCNNCQQHFSQILAICHDEEMPTLCETCGKLNNWSIKINGVKKDASTE